jgi:hypothetical protein
MVDAGQNPPEGVIIHYWLNEAPESLRLTIADAQGNEIRSFSSKRDKKPLEVPSAEEVQQVSGEEEAAEDTELDQGPLWAPNAAGMNRFVWDYRYERPTRGNKISRSAREEALEGSTGPRAIPGEYEIRLAVGERSLSQRFQILPDPRLPASAADLLAQFELKLAIRDRISETHTAINSIRRIREQVEEWEKRANDRAEVKSAAKSLKEQLKSIEGALINLDFEKPRPGVNRIKEKWDALSSIIDESDDAPTSGAREVYEMLRAQLEAERSRLTALIAGPLAEFSAVIQSAGVPAIAP